MDYEKDTKEGHRVPQNPQSGKGRGRGRSRGESRGGRGGRGRAAGKSNNNGGGNSNVRSHPKQGEHQEFLEPSNNELSSNTKEIRKNVEPSNEKSQGSGRAPKIQQQQPKTGIEEEVEQPQKENPGQSIKDNKNQSQHNQKRRLTSHGNKKSAKEMEGQEDGPKDDVGATGKQSNNRQQNNRKRGNHKNMNQSNKEEQSKRYPPHWSYEKCMRLYVDKDPNIVRGKLRVLPAKDGMGFCSCDRGSQERDVILESALDRNRGMNGDIVFVELFPLEDYGSGSENGKHGIDEQVENLQITESNQQPSTEELEDEEQFKKDEESLWQDDPLQSQLWNPLVPICRIKSLSGKHLTDPKTDPSSLPRQRKGRVVHVCAPPLNNDASKVRKPRRYMVGTLKLLQSGTCLFTPNDRLLPQFKCDNDFATKMRRKHQTCNDKMKDKDRDPTDLYKAEYVYHSWQENHSWPPCVNVTRFGDPCSIEDQIQGLLMENQVDHGEFTPQVLKNVEDAVKSGVYIMQPSGKDSSELGWKPTPEMYKGRRDYRNERIFTIDPTTAKDLDDALHIKKLSDGRIEVGVHIADVSAFITPGSDVDIEAQRRATTVYLVDRTVPMLPRPLCEVACSLNENVERLAFSCVWRMNADGTLGNSKSKGHDERTQDVWYGRTVIKSCARLDYATAQNIIEMKVANGEQETVMDQQLWPKSRRPTGGHTVEDVAGDVRLMHQVAMARRRLRFSNGALALHGVKLTFQLDDDGKTPIACSPYPIKDSNRLVEEYMLLANYLVAQRLITHAGDKAVLRRHPDPIPQGLDKVKEVAQTMFHFDVDTSSSAALHGSLIRLGAQCNDDLILQCITQMLTTPMQNADYFAAGAYEPGLWRHFALNIPYYTHFTSPIRRYADVLVHRLLQATIDGQESADLFPSNSEELQTICEHCNEKRLASKMAQERCDVVFLALYLRENPMRSQLGVVMSLGNKAITVYVPSVGVNAMLFLEEHDEWLEYRAYGEDQNRTIAIRRKEGSNNSNVRGIWPSIEIKIFSKILVSCLYKNKPRVDVKLELEGPAQ